MPTKPVVITSRMLSDAIRIINRYGHVSNQTPMVQALKKLLDGQHHLVIVLDQRRTTDEIE